MDGWVSDWGENKRGGRWEKMRKESVRVFSAFVLVLAGFEAL